MSLKSRLAGLIAGTLGLLAATATHAEGNALITASDLRAALGRGEFVLLDAQPAKLYEAGHIPGALHVDPFTSGLDEPDAAAAQRRIAAWGVSTDSAVVIYDQGGTYFAPRLYFELLYRGHRPDRLRLLDGGMAQWRATGGAVEQGKRSATAGAFRGRLQAGVRADLPEVLTASGDPDRSVLIDALDPSMYYGATKFFDRAGHLPHAVSWPASEFFNADKTFKSASQIRQMAAHLGVRPDQSIYSYCGGGIAAAVPFFALREIAGYSRVKLYVGSQLDWVRDSRELPLWTYAAPQMARSARWLAAWTDPLVRAYGVSRINVLDVRSAERFEGGHIPGSLNVPAAFFDEALVQPERVQARLEAAGVQPGHETVIVSERGLDRAAAIAFVALQSLGVPKVSVLMLGADEWALRGLPWSTSTTPATATRLNTTPRAFVVKVPAVADPNVVYVASGSALPRVRPAGTLLHLPAAQGVNDEGGVKPAPDVWTALVKAGVPRHVPLTLLADEPGDAAMNYFLLTLMGYRNLTVVVGG